MQKELEKKILLLEERLEKLEKPVSVPVPQVQYQFMGYPVQGCFELRTYSYYVFIPN